MSGFASQGGHLVPKKSSPPDSATDPVMQALNAKVAMLFAERCAVYGIPPDPDSKDFWRLMTYSFVFEHLMAELRPPVPKGKKTKPERWTAAEQKRLIESMREATTGGKTIADAAKTLSRTNRVSGKQGNIERRYYAAKKGVREAQRDAIARVLLRQSGGASAQPTGKGE
jgi:hypothetical protein